MTEAFSSQQPSDTATEYATIQFIVQSLLSRVATATPVRVVACTNSGGLSPWGTVDVQPAISQMSGNNVSVQYGNLFKLPYLRLQGGANAVIIDPQVGDLGVAIFCSRDISSMKVQDNIDQVKSGAVLGVPPASMRQYSIADGIYLGGILNAAPTQYVQFSSGGITLVSPTKITLHAPDIELTATGNVTIGGNQVSLDGTNSVSIDSSTAITIDAPSVDISGGAASIDGKPFLGHTHTGVQPGSGNTGGVT